MMKENMSIIFTIFLFVIYLNFAVSLQPPPGYPDMVDAGYPQNIVDKWIGADLTFPDATFQRISNAKIYFFKGTQYWRLTDKYLLGYPAVNVSDTVDPGYPQSIQAKWSIPGPIKAIFQRSDGKIYAFSGSVYYRFTDKYFNDNITDKTVPDMPDSGYPQNVVDKWLGVPASFDTAFYRLNHLIYFFAGNQYYRIRDKYYFGLPADAVETNYPQLISDKWIGLTSGINAVFQRTTSARKIYFFTGSVYNRFTDKYLLQSFADIPNAGYPQSIQTKWIGGIPDVIDGVFQRVGNGKIYFFAGTQYWRVTDKYLVNATNDVVDPGYPQLISDKWIGLPNSIDAVFQRSNGYIYFFKGTQYYRVFDKYIDPSGNTTGPDYVQSGYPQNIVDKFIGVPDNISATFDRITDKIYFFVGDLVYRVTDKYTLGYWPANDTVDPGYPVQTTSEFSGISNPPNGMFQRFESNREIYSFGTGQYWRITDQNLAVPDFESPPSFVVTSTTPTPASTSCPSTTPTPAPTSCPSPTCAPCPASTCPAPSASSSGYSTINVNFAGMLSGFNKS